MTAIALTSFDVGTLFRLLRQAAAAGQIGIQCMDDCGAPTTGVGVGAEDVHLWPGLAVLTDDGEHTGRKHDEIQIYLAAEQVQHLWSGVSPLWDRIKVGGTCSGP